MKKVVFSLLFCLMSLLNFAQAKTLDEILAGPWRGFSSEQVRTWEK